MPNKIFSGVVCVNYGLTSALLVVWSSINIPLF